MIKENELRLGNILLQKTANRISKVACTHAHFEMLSKGEGALLYPVLLKPELFESCGFLENKKYPLYPSAREFIRLLPMSGDQNEIRGYTKSNGECFARAVVNGAAASINVHHLHQLQNLYFALTGEELSLTV